MRLLRTVLFLVAGLVSTTLARSATGDQVLVVLEDAAEKQLYSQFWSDLECMLRRLEVAEMWN